MRRDVEISIIVPTYNERDNIVTLIERIDKALERHQLSYEVIIVDDSSPDGTAGIAKSLSLRYPVKVIVRKGKRGLSSAVLEGVKEAEGRFIVVMDADLQHPPEIIPRLYKRAIQDSCELVIASRYVPGGSPGHWSLMRKLISKGATYLARSFLPRVRHVKDPMSGFFLLRKDVLDGATLNPRGFKILLEILVKGNYRKVCEEPYVFGRRLSGESKLGTKEIVDYLFQVIELSPHWLKFAIVGSIGSVINLSTVALLRYALNIAHVVAAAVGIEISVLSNFYLNDIWTFRDSRSGKGLHRLIKFHISSATGIVVQYATSNALFYSGIIRESVTSQFMGILAGFVANYLLSKRYVWKLS
jgi:dolichol-phosphate mannosyltransferase